MTDRTIRLGCVVSYGMWGLGVLLVTLGVLLEVRGFGWFGLMVTAAAVTSTIRGFFVVQNRLIQGAFALGRESATATVPLQSVN